MSGQVMLARLSAQQCHKGILTCYRYFAGGSRAVHQLQQDTKSILPIFQIQQPAWSHWFFDKMRWCPMYTPIHIHTYPYTCWSPHCKLRWSASQATRGIFSTAWSQGREGVMMGWGMGTLERAHIPPWEKEHHLQECHHQMVICYFPGG